MLDRITRMKIVTLDKITLFEVSDITPELVKLNLIFAFPLFIFIKLFNNTVHDKKVAFEGFVK